MSFEHPASDAAIQEIHQFWFGPIINGINAEDRGELWWAGSMVTDEQIRSRFCTYVEQALVGEFQVWAFTATGRLALILLLDQFTRSIFRGTARAFAGDELALALCKEGLERQHDLQLEPIQRCFFYLPLEHTEHLEEQNRCLALYKKLSESVEDNLKNEFQQYVGFAELHLEIIRRFGRFPHRNALLVRENTPEETMYLKSAPCFGQ